MNRVFLALALGFLAASPATALEREPLTHATPPAIPHPLPQGVPYVIVGAEARPVVTLRYGVVDGRRVLLNARTMEVVYELYY